VRQPQNGIIHLLLFGNVAGLFSVNRKGYFYKKKLYLYSLKSFRQTAEFTNIGDMFYMFVETSYSFLRFLCGETEDPTRNEDITNIDCISQI